MAISIDEVKKLAALSRLTLTEEELSVMKNEIESILTYVVAVQKVSLSDEDDPSPHLENRNVMRADHDPHLGGAYTEALLAQAPQRKGRFLKVRKILGSP